MPTHIVCASARLSYLQKHQWREGWGGRLVGVFVCVFVCLCDVVLTLQCHWIYNFKKLAVSNYYFMISTISTELQLPRQIAERVSARRTYVRFKAWRCKNKQTWRSFLISTSNKCRITVGSAMSVSARILHTHAEVRYFLEEEIGFSGMLWFSKFWHLPSRDVEMWCQHRTHSSPETSSSAVLINQRSRSLRWKNSLDNSWCNKKKVVQGSYWT